ncbi:MAG: insulinase family protein [Chloroflexi bacterium]|nr:insulinase family protein [Chloroflexota bacterium]
MPGVPGPDDTLRATLNNGIVVYARPNFASPSIVIAGYLPAGAIYEPEDRIGLAGFTASMLLRGTKDYTHQQLFDILEGMAATLAIRGHIHTTTFQGRALAEDLPTLLQLLAQALRWPTFPNDELEKRRAQILTHLAVRKQDTTARAAETAHALLYTPTHPYGRTMDQVEAGVRATHRDDMLAFHRRYYGPRGMVIAVVGAVEPEAALEHVRAAFEDWINPDQPEAAPSLPPVHLPEQELRQEVAIPDKSQADIVLATIGPSRFAEDYLPAALGNSILGRFGMMGRIGKVVREQAGLAYYAYSSLSGGMGPGPWDVIAGVAPENVARALALIQQEVRRFVEEGVTEDELADVQSQAIGSLPLELETNAGVAQALLHLERYRLGLDYYRRYPAIIRSITTEQVNAAIRHYWHPGRWAIGIAGPPMAEARPSPTLEPIGEKRP